MCVCCCYKTPVTKRDQHEMLRKNNWQNIVLCGGIENGYSNNNNNKMGSLKNVKELILKFEVDKKC